MVWYALSRKKVVFTSFQCNPLIKINRGLLHLSWQVKNAHKITLSGIGDVSSLREIIVKADANVKSYTLTVHGYNSVITKTLPIDVLPFDFNLHKIKINPLDVSKINQATDQLRGMKVDAPAIHQTQNLTIAIKTWMLSTKVPDIQIPQLLMHVKNTQVTLHHNRLVVLPKVPEPNQQELLQLKQINNLEKLDEILLQLSEPIENHTNDRFAPRSGRKDK